AERPRVRHVRRSDRARDAAVRHRRAHTRPLHDRAPWRHGRDGRAGVKLDRRTLLTASAPLIAVALALLAGAGFIAAIGEDPLAIYALMARETLGTGYGIGQT